MSTMDISIAAELTTKRILCTDPSINRADAQRLAAELHDVLTSIRQLCAAGPRGLLKPVGHDVDLVERLTMIAVGIWPENDNDAAI